MQFALAVAVLMMASETPNSTEQWRANYELSLKAPEGWLSLAGLAWLRPGVNAVELPAHCGGKNLKIDFHDGHATLEEPAGTTELTLDKSMVQTCGTSTTFIKRGERYGIRLRDPEAATRRDFNGLKWFPINDKYRVRAAWHPYQPAKLIPITNILGDTADESSPGYAEFALDGRTYKLEPTMEDGLLFFMFRDLTASDLTYGSGRFLKAPMPSGDSVILDFNRAYNPPCAYTEFATCPLPPRQNRMAVRVEAGQQRYAAH